MPSIIVEQCVVPSLSTTTSRSPGGPFLNQFIPPSAQELREGHTGFSVSFSTSQIISGIARGAVFGAITGGAVGGIDGFLSVDGNFNQRLDAAISGAENGAVFGLLAGAALGGLGSILGPGFEALSPIAKARWLKALFVVNVAGSAYGVATSNTQGQQLFRFGIGAFSAFSLLVAIREVGTVQLASANPNAVPKIAVAENSPGILAIVDEEGNIINLGSGLTSHQSIAEEAGVLAEGLPIALKPGYRAITISKVGGQLSANNSHTFHGNENIAPAWVQEAIRKVFE